MLVVCLQGARLTHLVPYYSCPCVCVLKGLQFLAGMQLHRICFFLLRIKNLLTHPMYYPSLVHNKLRKLVVMDPHFIPMVASLFSNCVALPFGVVYWQCLLHGRQTFFWFIQLYYYGFIITLHIVTSMDAEFLNNLSLISSTNAEMVFWKGYHLCHQVQTFCYCTGIISINNIWTCRICLPPHFLNSMRLGRCITAT